MQQPPIHAAQQPSVHAMSCNRIPHALASRPLAHSTRAPVLWHAHGVRFATRCGNELPIRPHRCAAF
eukprot:11223415-Lingulodinium_polyedra.AAC.1